MKKGVAITLSVALVFVLAAAAVAGIGPSRGLPAVNLTLNPETGSGAPDNNYYSIADSSVAGRNGSVMCVACHTRNPAFRTAYRVANTWAVGSHWVTSNFNDTSKGGGYGDGTNAASGKNALRSARTTAIYMANNPTSGLWAAQPRYGVIQGTDNVGVNVNDPTGSTAAQMICESCHSILQNTGTAKLLALGFNNDNAALCIGCHSDMDPVISAEWQVHPADNTWAGTAHHRNSHSVDADARYFGSGANIVNGTYEMGTMNRNWWNGTVANYQMWSVNYGALGSSARNMSWSVSPRMRSGLPADNNQIRVASVPQGIGAGHFTPAADVLCTNCHRAHNADASTGGTILMRGTDTTTAMGNLPATPAAAAAWQGTRIMAYRGGRAVAFENINPLCLACHK